MSEHQNTVADYDEMIIKQEKRLLDVQDAVWIFLDTEHRLKEVKSFQAKVRTSHREINAILKSILANENLRSKFRSEANDLCKRTRELRVYTKEANKALTKDYAELKQEADNNRFDIIKEIGTLLAITGAFIAAIKGGVGDGSVTVDQATEAGLLLGIPILARKQIPKAFRAAAKIVCEAPEEIRNSFMLYYVKESIREKMPASMRRLREQKSSTQPVP